MPGEAEIASRRSCSLQSIQNRVQVSKCSLGAECPHRSRICRRDFSAGLHFRIPPGRPISLQASGKYGLIHMIQISDVRIELRAALQHDKQSSATKASVPGVDPRRGQRLLPEEVRPGDVRPRSSGRHCGQMPRLHALAAQPGRRVSHRMLSALALPSFHPCVLPGGPGVRREAPEIARPALGLSAVLPAEGPPPGASVAGASDSVSTSSPSRGRRPQAIPSVRPARSPARANRRPPAVRRPVRPAP